MIMNLKSYNVTLQSKTNMTSDVPLTHIAS